MIAIFIIIAVVAFGLMGTNLFAQGVTMTGQGWPGSESDPVWKVCHAIAHAEGYGKPGAAPTDLNNPGDLSPGDEHGRKTIGNPEFHGGSYVLHFATATDGWLALYTKIDNVRLRKSTVYSPDMTWQQFASEYAGDSVDWVNNVTAYLGVSPSSRVGDSLGV